MPPVFLSKMMKKGAPMIDVRIDTGISVPVTLRAIVSMTSMKIAPSPMLAGTTDLLLLPNAMREMCGMSNPTQPISPHIETTAAVIIVAPRMTSSRMRFTGTPSDVASSSLSVMRLSFHRKQKIKMIPAMMKGEPCSKVSFVVPDKLPSNQKVMVGSTS